MTPQLRKTRFICISDTHNASPADGAFKLPKGDVLIHAGDLTKQGTFAELRKTFAWIEDAEYEVKLVVAGRPIPYLMNAIADTETSGNHDITLDSGFYAEHGSSFHSQYPQDSQACVDLIKEYPSITYLNHEHVNIRLTKENGPQTGFKAFGSPYSPANGLWAFGYPPDKASELWDQSIPLDTDVVITHTPPKYHCDESRDRGAAGCETLRQKLWRVRPSLAICGHVHEGRGAERVIWDLETPNVKFKELATGYWTDPGLGNKKQSTMDLSSKSQVPLDNTGSWTSVDTSSVAVSTLTKTNVSTMISLLPWSFPGRPTTNIVSPLTNILPYLHAEGANPAVWGQGGILPSGRCDVEALAGRLGRRETCCINAAIMASSWPYKSKDNGRYNKPIVVDIDLPVWQQAEDSALPEQCTVSEAKLTPSDFTLSSQSSAHSVSS